AAEVRFDLSRSYVRRLDALDPAYLARILDEMAAQGAAVVREAGVNGTLSLTRSADMRYVGQGYELSVPIPDGPVDGRTAAALRGAFDRVYAHRYGYSDAKAAVEVVTVAVTVTGAGPEVRLPEQPPGLSDAARARKPDRAVYFPEARGYVRCAVYDRTRLPVGATIAGPAIVEEPESTTVLPPGTTAEVDPWANLIASVA
ncbi:MAG TPA: hydantoinase/oxoprolinase family protein, partial [Methylomirabilota bacterium]|nr:hydantoinase/oxoprolinase family protein [Methylomirabilota bacterium]